MELRIVNKPRKWSFTDYFDVDGMQREHDNLVKVLQNEGVRVHYLRKSTNTKPKLYILRDNAIILDKKAVTCHFIHSMRRGEEQLVKQRLKELGIKIVGHIYVPGFLQGSDVFFVNKNHAFARLGYETNKDGIKHLEEILKLDVTPLGTDNVPNTRFNVLNDVVIMSEELTDKPIYNAFKEEEFDIVLASRRQADDMALNFLQIDDYKIVNVTSDINKKLKMIGFDVIEVDIRELAKGGCGVRNMCLPLH
jgi:N-dimethylarginine dimethylaminohydrolase